MVEFTRPDHSTQNLSAIQWLGLALFNALFLTGIYVLLRLGGQPDQALRWLLLSGGASCYFLYRSLRWLPLNHLIDGEELLPSLGVGNIVTILRGMLIAGLAGFLFLPEPQAGGVVWIPGMLYTFACIADLLDGYLARRRRQPTRLGERLDLFLDGYGVLFASVLLFRYGLVPGWYLLAGGARYLFLAGTWLRRRQGKPVHELPPNPARRPLAGAQMGFMVAALFPVLGPPITMSAAVLFGIPFLVNFTLDWLAVSGVLPARVFRTIRQRVKI